VTTAGAVHTLVATMPSVAGFSSANINFALNAPAVGATLPLQISGALVTGPILAAGTGAAIASEYQHAGVTEVVVTLTNQSQGVWRTGTGLSLPPGVWLVRARCLVGSVAPELVTLGITKTVNGVPVVDDLSSDTAMEIHDRNNTAWTIQVRTDGYFRNTTLTTYYPTCNINTPAANTYAMTLYISAIRLN